MTKKFVYQVAGFEFVDSVAFGEAWKKAKAKAAELHAAVYRLVIKGEQVQPYEQAALRQVIYFFYTFFSQKMNTAKKF